MNSYISLVISVKFPAPLPPELSNKVLFLLLILGGFWSPHGAPAVGVNQRPVVHPSLRLHVRKLPGKEDWKVKNRGLRRERHDSCIPPLCFSARNHQGTFSTFRLFWGTKTQVQPPVCSVASSCCPTNHTNNRETWGREPSVDFV